MDKLDMFQAIFGKVDDFVWWNLKLISADEGTQFTLRSSRMNVKPVVFGLL